MHSHSGIKPRSTTLEADASSLGQWGGRVYWKLVHWYMFHTLCVQKERDLELAARIGQSLLANNEELKQHIEDLKDQVSHNNEKVPCEFIAIVQWRVHILVVLLRAKATHRRSEGSGLAQQWEGTLWIYCHCPVTCSYPSGIVELEQCRGGNREEVKGGGGGG